MPFIIKKIIPHAPFLAVLGGGVLLRVWALMAYHPGLLFLGDSPFYMQDAQSLSPTSFHPLGYALFIRLVTETGRLVAIPLAQHILGLVAGILIYFFLLRVGMNKWLAALGSAPILLDAYGIDLESTILTEALVSVLLVVIFVVLFWNRKTPSKVTLISAGVLLAFTTITRSSVAIMLVPMLAYVAITARAQSRKIKHIAVPVAVLLAAFALPLLGYSAYHYSKDRNFTIDTKTPFFLYSKLAPLADCKALSKANQLMCAPLTNVPGEVHDTNWYLWWPDTPMRMHYPNAYQFVVPEDKLQQFDIAVLEQKPLQYAASTLGQTLSYFGVNDVKNTQDSSPTNVQFPTKPLWNPYLRLADSSLSPMDVVKQDPKQLPSESAAKKLHAYQRVAYVPGPVLALAVLLVVGAVWIKRNRQTLIAATLTSSALAYLLLTCALAGPYYRFIVPVETLFVAGGVIAFDVIIKHTRKRKTPKDSAR